jgi:hypothetical protein
LRVRLSVRTGAHLDSIRSLLVRMIASRIRSNRSWAAAPSTASRSPSPALRAVEEPPRVRR